MITYLDFEKPIAELESRISDLRAMSDDNDVDMYDEIEQLQDKLESLLRDTYADLDPWQKTQVARHPDRPHLQDYIDALIAEFTPLAGDRNFAEDHAVTGGLGRYRGQTVMVIGQEKGRSTQDRVKHNFGMARPEGYRKAIRLMDLANRFEIPVLTFVDTPGAYPGIGAEERGQAEAIARCIEQCLRLEVPLISVVIGEGGSGGAVALASGNHVLIMEHAIYSVISPEGCASILWRSAEKARQAAEALKLTAQDLKKLGVVDDVIPEPVGGAHREPLKAIQAVDRTLSRAFERYRSKSGPELRRHRYDKFIKIGQVA